MNYLFASIITTLALIWLSSHDFHKKTKRTHKQAIKRIQFRDLQGRFSNYLPLELTYAVPVFRQVSISQLVRV